MSVRRLSPNQPASFAFTPENAEWAKGQIAKYPEGRQASAILPLFWQAQKQAGGWLPEPAIRYVAEMLKMDYIRALEVATFYTMFNLSPVGEHYVQLCGTTPCWLRGSDELKEVCRKHIGPEGQVSADGKMSWIEVECLGACANAPMVQINDDFYEDLDGKKLEEILGALRDGKSVKPGPQNGRHSSEPIGGLTSLTSTVAGGGK
jgi:NADH-quinone oxidoreductase subunit E